MIEKFTVRVPASTSNLGSGFDTISAALDLYLRVTVTPADAPGIGWTSGWDSPDENMVEKALQACFARLGRTPPGLRLAMENPIPLKRGLGSSGAAIVAGIKIAERLSGEEFPPLEAMEIGYPLEGHPDNLAASLLGGWVLSCVSDGRVQVERISASSSCRFVVAVPETPVSTAEARSILPTSYSRVDAVFNLQRCALLVHALHTGRTDLLSEAVRDRLHQPFRSGLVPGLPDLLSRKGLPHSLGSSLLGIAISGSGSCVLGMVSDHGEEVGRWMVGTLLASGTSATFLVLDLDPTGAVVEDSEAG